METLDHHLCGVAIKRAVQKLSEFLGDEASKQEDRLMKDVLKLLQLMYSKVGLIQSLTSFVYGREREGGRERE